MVLNDATGFRVGENGFIYEMEKAEEYVYIQDGEGGRMGFIQDKDGGRMQKVREQDYMGWRR